MHPEKFTNWRKSSRSGGGDNCIEVVFALDGTVGMRDSKDRTGPVLGSPWVSGRRSLMASATVSLTPTELLPRRRAREAGRAVLASADVRFTACRRSSC